MMPMETIFQCKELIAGYGKKIVLQGVSIDIERQEVVGLFGPNGAGKSTFLMTAYGLIQPKRGSIIFQGEDITRQDPARNSRRGISLVPQGGRVFRNLTVHENLQMGAFSVADKSEVKRRLEMVYDFFPPLSGRKEQSSKSLSGGERQMLAIGIALMIAPKLLLLDEPSIGLAPKFVEKIMEKIKLISAELAASIILVEQKVKDAMDIIDRMYVMNLGRIVDEAKSGDLPSVEKIRAKYFFAQA